LFFNGRRQRQRISKKHVGYRKRGKNRGSPALKRRRVWVSRMLSSKEKGVLRLLKGARSRTERGGSAAMPMGKRKNPE